MKVIASLLAAAVLLAITLAATRFDFDVALLISLGAILGIVGLFVFEYRRIRHRSAPAPTRRRSSQPPAQTPPVKLASEFPPAPHVAHTWER